MLLLSEAIRLGATWGPQAFGSYIDDKLGTCAIGAALLATGDLKPGCIEIKNKRNVWELFPSMNHQVADTVYGQHCSLFVKITYLNDIDGWSREQIADWIVEKGYDCEYVPPSTHQVKTQEVVGEAVAV